MAEPTGEGTAVPMDSRGNVGRFTAINVVGGVLPLIVAIVTVPRYLHMFGQVRYGVWLVTWALISYFGVVDLGLGRATANSIAKLQTATARQRETVVWTGVTVNLSFGIAAAAL